LFENGLDLNTRMVEQKQHISVSNELELFERFQILLKEHFVEYDYADLFADKLNVSQKKLNTVTKELTGKTACQLVEEKLVSEAMLLFKSKITIKEIAFQLGYEDPYYFSRIFKIHTGLSPKHFRNRLRSREK